MRAAVCPTSGSPDVLYVTDVERPEPRPNELLIEVRCATVTSGDVNMRELPRVFLWALGAVIGFKRM